MIESKFSLINELYKAFEGILDSMSSHLAVYLSLAIKSEQIKSILENNLLNNGFGFEADLRVDSVFLGKLRDVAKNNMEGLLNSSEQGALLVLFMFEELKL